MQIFYDTEFLEDGSTIDLISIGMVADDGRELYLVNEAIVDDEKLFQRIGENPWLIENVIPSLPLDHTPGFKNPFDLLSVSGRKGFRLDRYDNRIVPLRFIRNAVRDFILATPHPQLWAWYGAYDHVVYAQLFGPMSRLPDGLPMFTCDLKQECVRLGDPQVPEQETGQHNALEDARHNRVIAQFLAEYAAKVGA